MKEFSFKIKGIIRGGKNHINITRTGQRYPNREWAKWRDMTVSGIKRVMPNGLIFDAPVEMWVQHIPSDKRKRDLPAMIDAIFHCMEKAGLITDDCLVKNITWETWANIDIPGATITIREK